FTISANLPTSPNQDETKNQPGYKSWQNADARPWSRVLTATTPSMQDDLSRQRRRNHWRAGCSESEHVRFGGGPLEKGLHLQIPRQRPTRPEDRWAAAAVGDRVVGGQDRSAGGSRGTQRGLQGGLQGLLVRVPTQAWSA